MTALPPFPVDDGTLDLLCAAIDPRGAGDELAERSCVGDFLDMMSQLGGSDTAAVAEEYAGGWVEMRDPAYSTHDVMTALVDEVRRLRIHAHRPEGERSVTPNATLSIDGAAEIPCTLAVTTQAIEVSSFSGTSSPDLVWTFVDTAGHFHAFDHDGKLPTLETRTVWHAYEEPDEDTGEIGYEVSTSHCILCGEEVNAKYVTTFDPGRRLAPGRTEWKLTFTGDAPPRFSAVVRTDGRTYFGVAETVHRRGVHHPEDHLAYGGPMSYRPLPVPPWRLGTPEIPGHVVCVQVVDEGLWVRVDHDRWGEWVDRPAGGHLGSARMSTAALLGLTPLVERPDPRKATT